MYNHRTTYSGSISGSTASAFDAVHINEQIYEYVNIYIYIYIYIYVYIYIYIYIYVCMCVYIYIMYIYIYISRYSYITIQPWFNSTTNTHEFVPLERHEFVMVHARIAGLAVQKPTS